MGAALSRRPQLALKYAVFAEGFCPGEGTVPVAMTPTSIVAYLALFAGVAFLFALVSLLLGRLLRAQAPSPQKLEPYECGEPAVGSTAVQFDLRFYVVALVFLIFEVEVTLFFPPAAIFGKATQLMARESPTRGTPNCASSSASPRGRSNGAGSRCFPAGKRLRQTPAVGPAAMADLGLFFAVILAGFAYVWWRGDLSWVRAVGPQSARTGEMSPGRSCSLDGHPRHSPTTRRPVRSGLSGAISRPSTPGSRSRRRPCPRSAAGLRDEPELRFNMLHCISGIDYFESDARKRPP